MHRASLILAAGLAASTIACARRTPEIDVSSSDFDVNPLVGEWRGTSNNPETGRSGTIAFTLNAGESSASGNIVIIPRADSLLTPEERELVSNVSAPKRQVLQIHFIRKEGGNLNGTLDPYVDPECGCQVTTTFQGIFQDARTIAGTFTIVPSKPGHGITSGKWMVKRVKKL